VLRQNSMLGIVALGMTFVIVMGGVDLSVGSMLAVGGVVAAKLTPHGSLVAIVTAVALCALLGTINGLVIVKARIQPFITTLAMMIAARGVALLWTGDESVKADRAATGFKTIGRGMVGPIPVPVIILFIAFAIGWVVLAHTRFGRHVYAVGDNEEAARLMGLNVEKVNISVYALSGALAGFAGVLLASRLGAGQPVAGTGWELDAIAAVVVGGTLLTGGQGGAFSTLVGVLLLGVIFNVFNLEGTISSWWQWVLRGAFLLTVIVVQNRLSGQNESEGPAD
jgi:ribose transport system permease protein